MAEWELRPLSLGEILDRTFSLYRRHFLLFLGITAIPQLLILALNLAEVFVATPRNPLVPPGSETQFQRLPSTGLMAFGFVGILVAVVVYLVAFLFAQGGTIYAVSDLYLGRPATIAGSLGRMRGHLLKLLGVMIVNGLAVMVGFLLLIVPGIILACRLITCIPAALLEDRGVFESMNRSMELTKGSTGRAFVIYLLYVSILYGAILLFDMPFLMLVAASAKNPEMLRLSMSLMQVGNFAAGVLVGPFLLIASSVFYYDLRVRKEAFDLQMMMGVSGVPTEGASVPTVLS